MDRQCTHATSGHHTAFCGALKAAFLNLKLNYHQSLIMKMEIPALMEQSMTLVSHTEIVNSSGFPHVRDSSSFQQEILTSLVACYILFPKFKAERLPSRKELDPRGSRYPTCDMSQGLRPLNAPSLQNRTSKLSSTSLDIQQPSKYSNSHTYVHLSSSMLSIPQSI